MKRWRLSLVAMVVASSVLPLAAANASARGATGSAANSRHSAVRHAHVAPSVPANVVATAGDASVAVSWDSVAGADGYVAMADPGGFSCQTANSSCVISGLTNGTTYSVTVTASAAGLMSDASAPVSATPQAGPPLAALGVTAFTIGTTATVTWLPANSSTPITGYTVTASPGGLTCSVSAVDGVVPTTCIVTGLTAGQTYTFSVVATNSVGGSSPATAPTVTPVDTPSAPTNVSTIATSATITVSWTPSASDGGAPISGYTALAFDPVTNFLLATCGAAASGTSCVMSALAPNTSYYVRVFATNAQGPSDPSLPTDPQSTAPTTPGSPVPTSLTAGNGSATVTWTAPEDNGGATITSYTATADDGNGGVFTCAVDAGSTSCLIKGLTNGTSYTVTIAANNVAGGSLAVTAGVVTPASVPDAPTNITVTPASGAVTVSWSAPASDGGSAIYRYTATATDFDGNAFTCTTTGTSCVITALTNGYNYDITVVATNAVGDSVPAEGGYVTPSDVPGAPIPSSLTFGNGSITASWSAPLDNGGLLITGYTATATDGDGNTFTCTTDGTSCVIDGVTNGISYNVVVVATNADGDSSSVDLGSASPATIPTAPLSPSVSAGNRTLNVSWSPSASNGGRDVTGYTVTATDGDGNSFSCSTGVDGTSCLITGLTNGVSYAVSITATNVVGASDATDAGSTTPSDVPGAPVASSLTFGNGSITASWSAPLDNGGLVISSYTATATDGDGNTFTCTTDGTSCVIDGLTNGVSYNVTVVATNADGDSSATALGSITPATTPDAPGSPVVTVANGSFTVKWAIPAVDGGSAITGFTASATDSDGNTFSCFASSTDSSCLITGVANSVSYDITLVATNSVGDSVVADAGSFIADTVPSVPLGGSLIAGNASLAVSWSTPTTDGGSPITSYTATATDGDGNVFACDSKGLSCDITGLTNGVSYDVIVVATNSVGNSVADSLGSATPVTAPSSPAVDLVAPGSTSIGVSWITSTDNGGSPITGYTATATDGDGNVFTCSAGSADTSCTITGLTNGTTYAITIIATSNVGSSVPTNAGSATPSGVPGAPLASSLTFGNGNITASWSAPLDNGGLAVLSYTATATDGDGTTFTCTTDGTSCVIDGLTNGVSYNVTVVATNADGDSSAAALGSIIPATNPSAPADVSTSVGNGSVTVSWSGSLDNGGSNIISYTVTATDGDGNVFSCSTASDGTSCTIYGVANGTTYAIAVYATNSVGDSTILDGGAAVPFNLPSVPTSGSATFGDARITASWSAPLDNGGLPVLSYTATATDTNGNTFTCTTDGTSCTINGLTNGTRYSVTVIATTSAGNSGAADLGKLTPAAAPSAPGNITATPSNGSLYVGWDYPAFDGGAYVTSYLVTATDGDGNSFSCIAGPGISSWWTACSVYGLTNGVSYDITVVATNAAGSSSPADGGYFTPATTPSAPSTVTVTPADQSLTVTWSAPTSDGGNTVTSYTATATDINGNTFSCTTDATSCVITGLTNGVPYDVTVVSTNAMGQSDSADAGLSTPSTVPGAPTNLSFTSDGTTLTISWSGPNSDGGLAIDSYVVTLNGVVVCETADLSCSISSLAAATNYSLTVTAVNADGTSLASDALDLSDVAVVRALANVSADRATIVDTLKNVYHASASDAAQALLSALGVSDYSMSAWLSPSGYVLPDIATALHVVYGDTAWQTYFALRDWYNESPDVWVSVLDGANYSTSDIAYTLHYALTLTSHDAAHALWPTYFFSDAQVAPVLVGAGYTNLDVALTLRDVYFDSASDTANALTVGLGLSVNDVSWALVASGAFSPIDLASTLRTYFELSAADAATVFSSVFGSNDTNTSYYLYQGGYTLGEVSAALRVTFGETAQGAFYAMRNWISLTPTDWASAFNDGQFTLEQIAFFLRNGFGVSPQEAATVLISIFNLDDATMASVLVGAGYSSYDVALVLRNQYSDSPSQAASVLQTALGLTVNQVSQAMLVSGAYSPAELANALRQYFEMTSVDAAILFNAVFGSNDSNTATYLYQGGYSLIDATYALNGAFHDSATGAYNALRWWVSGAPADWVTLLNNAQYSVSDIAFFLRNGFGVNPQDAAYALNQAFDLTDMEMAPLLVYAGYSTFDVALVLRYQYTDDSSRTALVLNEALGLSPVQVAQAEVNSGAYSSPDLATALRTYYENSTIDASIVFNAAFGTNDTWTALYLFQGGYTLNDVAYAMHYAFCDTSWQAYYALRNWFSLSPTDWVALLNYAEYKTVDIAFVLRAFMGVGPQDAAYALNVTFAFSDSDIAPVLIDAGYSTYDVAVVLKYEYGDSAIQTASVLQNSLNLSDIQVAQAEVNSGAYSRADFAGVLYNYYEYTSSAAMIVFNTAFGDNDTWSALYLYQGGYSLTEIATALHATFGDTAWQTYYALRNWFGLSTSEWVSVLSGADYSVTDITFVLHAFIGVRWDDAARAINQTYDFTDSDLAPILLAGGYSSYDVALVLRWVYGDDANRAAEVLSTALNLSDVQVGQAMVNSGAYAMGDFSSALRLYFEYSSYLAGTVLVNAFGFNDSQTAYALFQGGYSANDVAFAMKFVFGDNAGQTFQAIRYYVNLTLNDWVSVLNFATFSAVDTAFVLHAYMGVDWNGATNALNPFYDFTDDSLANVLVAAGYSSYDVALSLRWAYGDSPSQAACVLSQSLQLSDVQVAQAMVNSGAYSMSDLVGAISSYFEYNAVDAATLLARAFGFNDAQVVSPLIAGGYGAPDVAYALHFAFNDASWQTFNAEHYVVSLSDADWVSVLTYAQYIASDVAFVLHYYIGDSASSATSALNQTLYLSDSQLVSVLASVGYSSIDAARVLNYYYEDSANIAFAIVSDVYGTSNADTVWALRNGGYNLSVPDAPFSVNTGSGNGVIFVSWNAGYSGGLAIQSFTATAVDGSGNRYSCTTSGDGNWCLIYGLSNGTSYSVSVIATNYVGDSAASDVSYATPATAPSAPSDVSAILSGTTLTVKWTDSVDNGGSPITGYRAHADNGDGGPSCTTGPEATTCTITGLILGQTYTVSVVAINAVDQSPASTVDGQFVPVTHPSAPSGVWTSSLDGGLTIYWSPSNDTGGSPITNYHIDVIDPSGLIVGSCDTLDFTCTVMGLTNWVTYNVLAKAENAQGSSDPLTTVPSGDNARDIVAYQSGWLALTGSSVQQSDPFFDLSSINSMLSDSCTARTMAVAPDGSVWIENFCGTYFHLNLDGSVDTFNPDGWSSFAIAVAPNGDVLGTNWSSDITVFDPSNGSWTTRWVDGAACLTGIAYTPDGSLYVADPCYSQVRQLTGDPTDPSSSLSLYDGPQIYVGDAMGLASAGDGTLVVGNDWWQTATINPLTGEVNYFQSPLPCNEHLAVVQGVVITADGCWNRFGVGGVSQTTGQPQSATPSAPQSVVVQTGSHHIVVTWSAPQYNGIAGPTTSYTATATDSKGNAFSCSQAVYYACIIDGLTDEVVYRVNIVANNVAGSSAPFIAGNFMPVTASVSIPSDYQSAQPNTNNLLTSLSASGAAPMVSNLSDGASVIVSTSLGNLWMPNSNGLTPLRNTPFTSGTIIGFSGSTESVNAALQSLEIYSQQTGTFTLTIQVIDAGFAYDPVSGHAFFQANCNNCTFMDAVNGANQFSLNGVGGYLVSDSTSSANEVLNRYMWQSSFGGFTDYQPYLVDASGNPLFAYQYANNDVSTSFDNSQYLSDPNASFQKWIYVSGPHKGDIMTLGGVRYGFCSAAPAMAQNGYFANWGNGEPNDCGANEFVPIIGSYAGRWNDVGPQATLGSSVIEFGGLASDTGSLTIAHVASATGRVSSPPSQPGDVSVYARNQSLVVTVGSPSDGSGNPVTYTYVASPTIWGGNDGATCVTTDTTCTLGGLTWGQSYYVTVYASTVAGNSSWAYAGYYDIALEMSTTVDGNTTVLTLTNHDPVLSSAWINARSSGPTLRWCDFEGLEVNVAQTCTINGLEYRTNYQLTADTSTAWGARVLAVAPISTGKYTPLYGSTPPRTFATMWNDAPQATAVDATNNVWRIANSSTVEVDSFDGTALATYDLSAALPGGAWPVRIAALPQGGAVVALNGYSGGWMSLGAIVISPTGAVTYVDGNSSTVGQVAVDPVTGNVAITSGSGVAFLDTTNLTWSNVFPGTGSVDTRYDSVAFDSSGNLWFTGNGNTSYFYEVTSPFGDWNLTTVPVPVAINYTNQVMVSVAGIFYILGGDNQVTAWNPVTNETTSLGLHNEFPQSAQWWGLNLPAVTGVGNGWIAFSVSEYGWNGGPGSTVFEMPIPVLS